jgi:hypothetical protein
MPLVTQIEFTNILDWRCYTPELDGFVVRLHVLDAPTAHFSTFASASSSDSKLALLGLPRTDAGYAVRDAIIRATLDLSRFASLDRSTLGRPPGETHPCL